MLCPSAARWFSANTSDCPTQSPATRSGRSRTGSTAGPATRHATPLPNPTAPMPHFSTPIDGNPAIPTLKVAGMLDQIFNSRLEPMDSTDVAWLRMDSDSNLMVVVGVFLLAERVSLTKLRETVESRFLVFHLSKWETHSL